MCDIDIFKEYLYKDIWSAHQCSPFSDWREAYKKVLITNTKQCFFSLSALPQSQFSHIGASLHTRTPFSYRVPVDSQPFFLLINVLYAVVPQVLCYRCHTQPAFFIRTTEKKTEWQHEERECQRCQGCLTQRLKYMQGTAQCFEVNSSYYFWRGKKGKFRNRTKWQIVFAFIFCILLEPWKSTFIITFFLIWHLSMLQCNSFISLRVVYEM